MELCLKCGYCCPIYLQSLVCLCRAGVCADDGQMKTVCVLGVRHTHQMIPAHILMEIKTCHFKILVYLRTNVGPVAQLVQRLTMGWTVGDRIPVGTRFSAVQTGPRAHPASCKMGTGSFPGVKCGRGMLLATHPLLVPRSWKSRAIPLPTLQATQACNRDYFTFTFTSEQMNRIAHY